MGKRSNFERKERDFYVTPYKAVTYLLPHLDYNTHYIEPCAGDGALIKHLAQNGHTCVQMFDIEPQDYIVSNGDMFDRERYFNFTKTVITNPPWDRNLLHKLIELHREMGLRSFLLFDADWLFTKQSIPYRKHLKKVIPVGRISWMGNGTSGKDNCCWYEFSPTPCETIFA
jgi:hypothetical protein